MMQQRHATSYKGTKGDDGYLPIYDNLFNHSQAAATVVLEPPGCLASAVRGALQLLAYPLASYIGFFSKARAVCWPRARACLLGKQARHEPRARARVCGFAHVHGCVAASA